MADISLLFDVAGGGSISGESGAEIQEQLTKIVSEINSTPFKIKFEADEASLNRMKTEIANIISSLGGEGIIKLGTANISEVAQSMSSVSTKVNEVSSGLAKTLTSGTVEYYNALRQINNELDSVNQRLRTYSSLKNENNGVASTEYSNLSNQINELNLLQKSIQSAEMSADSYKAKFAEIKLNIASASNALKEFAANEVNTSVPKTLTSGTTEYYNALRQISNELETVNQRLRTYSSLKGENNGTASTEYSNLSGQINQLDQLQKIIQSGEMSTDNYKAKFAEIKLNIDSASNALKEFTANDMGNSIFSSQIKGYDAALKKTEVLLKKVANAKERWTAAKSGSTSGDYQNIVSYHAQLEQLYSNLKDGKITVNEFKQSFEELDRGANIALTNIKKSGKDTLSVMDRLRSLTEKFGVWLSISRMVMTGVKYTKQMIKASIELQDAFTQLKIVTGATEAQMESFARTTISLAKSLGKSVTDIAKSVETFSRLGYNLSDASKLAEYATILSNVASVDTNEATTGMTSIIKGYDMNVANTEHVADVLIEVGQKYAVSASELMDAFEHAGAALSATNTSFEKSAGLIAAANASVQNSSTVGKLMPNAAAMCA